MRKMDHLEIIHSEYAARCQGIWKCLILDFCCISEPENLLKIEIFPISFYTYTVLTCMRLVNTSRYLAIQLFIPDHSQEHESVLSLHHICIHK